MKRETLVALIEFPMMIIVLAQPFICWYIWEIAGDTWYGRGFITMIAYMGLRGFIGGKND